jgi:hypothetical protein
VSVPLPRDHVADAGGFARREREFHRRRSVVQSVPSSSIVGKPVLLTAMRTASRVTLMQ